MNHHNALLSQLGLDPQSGVNLHYIDNPYRSLDKAGQFQSVNESNKIVYEHIVHTFLNKHMFSYEIDAIVNQFARSPVSLEALYEDTFKAQQPRVSLMIDENLEQAIESIQNAFRPRKKLYPIHFADTRYYPWPLSSNIELPYSNDKEVERYLLQRYLAGDIPDRKTNFHNLYNYVFQDLRPKIHRIKLGHCFNHDLKQDLLYPMTAHVRPGLGKAVHGNMKIKNRLVYGVSKTQLVPECMFSYPLFREYLDSGLSPLLWNYETLNGGWTRLRSELLPTLPRVYFVFSGDWSQFDHRVLFELMNIIYIADMSYYHFDEYQPTEDFPYATVNPQKLINLYIWLIYATFSSPLLMPDNKLIMRTFAALASGMFRTQYMDSKINGIMLLTIFSDAGFYIDSKHMLKLMGDDNFAIVWTWLPVSSRQALFDFLSERALTRFGAVLSVDASEFHDSLDFVELLGYRNFCGHAYRDPLKLLAQLLYPESNSFKLSSLMARTIGITYADLGRNSRLERVCHDIYDYLKLQGIRPQRRTLMHMFDRNVVHSLDIQTDHFPSRLEIQKHLTIPKSRSPTEQDRYWPSQFFIDPEDTDRRLAALMREFKFSTRIKI